MILKHTSNIEFEALTCGSEICRPDTLKSCLGSMDELCPSNNYQLFHWIIQSSETIDEAPGAPTGMPGSSTLEQVNVHFMDQNLGSVLEYESLVDEVAATDKFPGINLNEWLSRPTLIYTRTWLETDAINSATTFNPWQAYFANTANAMKLNYYAFLRCRLKLKVVVNASPFYYGACLLNYQPLSGFNASTIKSDSINGNLVPHSQRPHIWIYPQSNAGGEITLPFFLHKNWLDATSSSELANMGQCSVIPYTILQSANGATGQGVTIQVFAWAEDVELMGPTVSLAVQGKDEYATGPVSRTAHAIAEATSKISKAPYIGKYMTATSSIASSIGNIASLFGFTNPPNISDVDPLKSMPFPALSSSEISTPVDKLTLDPKNELTIDPRTVGLEPVDELEVSYLVQKESFLMNTQISTTDSINTEYFNALVNPVMHTFNAADTYPIYQTTPMCYASQLFKYWRGDIIFRFKFICTKFHKARLRISYDPRGDLHTTSDSVNLAFTQIVDIGETTDVEVRVPYMQATSWLEVQRMTGGPYWTPGNAITHDKTFDNGIISVRLLNVLSAPTSTGTINMMVFVRGGDNLEFNMLTDAPQTLSNYSIQSLDTIDYDVPTQVVAGSASDNQHPARFLVNFGESIRSFRKVLRRSVYAATVSWSADTTNKFLYLTHYQTKYPSYWGYDPNGFQNAQGLVVPASNFKFNVCSTTPYNWIAPMFIGQKGAVIYHYNLDSSCYGTTGVSALSVNRYGNTISTSSFAINNAIPASATSGATLNSIRIFNKGGPGNCGTQGLHLTAQQTQAGLSVSLPNYTKYRFMFTNPTLANIGTVQDDSNRETYVVTAAVKPTLASSSVGSITMDKYMSIGTDFTFFFFLNTPSLQLTPIPTTIN